MYALERDYTYLVAIHTESLKEAMKIANEKRLPLYKDGKLIYIPSINEGSEVSIIGAF